jgi:hypothetical protein
MYLLPLQFYCNDNAVWEPTKKQNGSPVLWQVILLYLLFVLYKGPTMDSFNPKHVTKAYEKEYTLSSTEDSSFFLLSL